VSFRLILWLVGTLLSLVSRVSSRLRAQAACDISVTIATRDGVSRTYLFRERRISSHPGIEGGSDCTLIFPSASVGARIFLAPNAVEQIVEGITSGNIEIKGLPAIVLWFYEMVMGCVPGRKKRHTMPSAYTRADPNSKVADRITREPAQNTLDHTWSGAVRQRENLMMWKVGQGTPAPNKIKGFRHVVDLPATTTEKSS